MGICGTVVIITGFNAHSGYYSWVAEHLIADGLAVYAVDLRGRRNSDGERFYVDTVEDHVRDVEAVTAVVKTREPGQPVFLLGHSAGCVVACLYTLEHPADVAGLICESFAHELPAPDFALAVFKALSHIAPHAHVLHFPNDPNAVEAMNNDPLIYTNANMAMVDRVSQLLVGSTNTNIIGLTFGNPVQAPTLSSTCVDDTTIRMIRIATAHLNSVMAPACLHTIGTGTVSLGDWVIPLCQHDWS